MGVVERLLLTLKVVSPSSVATSVPWPKRPSATAVRVLLPTTLPTTFVVAVTVPVTGGGGAKTGPAAKVREVETIPGGSTEPEMLDMDIW